MSILTSRIAYRRLVVTVADDLEGLHERMPDASIVASWRLKTAMSPLDLART